MSSFSYKKLVLTVLKFVVPLAIIAWLVLQVDRDQLRRLWSEDTDWSLLALGSSLAMLSVCMSFVRWYLLVRALDMPFRLVDAFRLGFLTYLLNFVGAGSVGGDLFRAVFIAREQPGRRTEAVATVLADRLVGFYALLLVNTCAILLTDVSNAHTLVRMVCNAVLVLTAIGTGVIVLVLIPRFRKGRLLHFLNRLPKVGPVLGKLILVVQTYGARLPHLFTAGGISVGIHLLLAISIYFMAVAIITAPPTLAEHCVIVPLSMAAGALPLTPAGLGTFEVAMRTLYEMVPLEKNSDGVIVALVYRTVTIVIAAIGIIVYWFARREVTELLEEADV
jgi:uncharacterized protein (TIRG00374 family)